MQRQDGEYMIPLRAQKVVTLAAKVDDKSATGTTVFMIWDEHGDEGGGPAMKVMVLVKANADSEAGVMPGAQLLAEMGKYNEELVRAGILLAAEGLHPSSKGVRVRFAGADRTVTDGPFAETKELLAGFWLWRVKSMDEAIEWVKRCPNPMPGESEIEIRPVFDAEDFASSDPTGELRAAERRLRAEAEGLAKS